MKSTATSTGAAGEIEHGERFAFGRNWNRFLAKLTAPRIEAARQSLVSWLGTNDLSGRSFIDVGSGSGVFSLAARNLGAQVTSFDYDPDSVACALHLKARHFESSPDWRIETGSVLDKPYLATLGQHDVVYSWGVLHHTGAMYEALDNVVALVRPQGQLFIAIYNDQAWITRYWLAVKRIYNRSAPGRLLMIAFHAPYLFGLRFLVRQLRRSAAMERGMSLWYDMLDWLGGYPFEVAKPEDIVSFYRDRGFELERLRTCYGRHGCNEFLFRRK